jgi:hypothetical protein
MAGYWELWDLETRNALTDFETEEEGLAFVRELLGLGWKAADLSFFYDDSDVDVELLKPAISGEELARRAAEAVGTDPIGRATADTDGTDPIRRTA